MQENFLMSHALFWKKLPWLFLNQVGANHQGPINLRYLNTNVCNVLWLEAVTQQ